MQAEAIADVDRIAQEIYETGRRMSGPGWLPWRSMDHRVHDQHRRMVRDLLLRDVIRIGNRPIAEPPMEGQLSIDD